MKKTLKTALAALMILALLLAAALAENSDAAEPAENGVVSITAACGVFAEPSLESEALTEVLEGDRLTYLYEAKVDGSDVVWYSVNCGDINGWVPAECAAYLGDDICYETVLEDVEFIEATGGDSNIRTAPDREAEIIGLLKQGQVIVYAGVSYVDYRAVRWDYVELEDGRGWISSMYTTPKAPEGEN